MYRIRLQWGPLGIKNENRYSVLRKRRLNGAVSLASCKWRDAQQTIFRLYFGALERNFTTSLGGDGQGGRPLSPSRPLTSPLPPLISLLPSGAARALCAQKFPLSSSLPFFLPSPSSRPLFSPSLPLLPPPAPSPPSPSSPPPPPLLPLPLTLSAPRLGDDH